MTRRAICRGNPPLIGGLGYAATKTSWFLTNSKKAAGKTHAGHVQEARRLCDELSCAYAAECRVMRTSVPTFVILVGAGCKILYCTFTKVTHK